MKYEKYDIDDFLKDEFFIQWVVRPDSQSDFFWKRWIENHPGKHKIVMEAREIILSLDYKHRFNIEQDKADQILENVLNEKNKNFYQDQSKPVFNNLLKIAASFLFLVGVGFFIWKITTAETEEQAEIIEKPMEWVVRNVPTGEKATLKLTDGTIVKINAESSFEFQKPFPSEERLVKLEGEAYFEVSRDGRPFIIETGDVKTKVLGTSFNIKYYKNSPQIEVAVVSGKVQVDLPDGNSQLLLPEEIAVYNSDIRKVEKEKFDLKKVTAWKDGILYFEKENLDRVFNELEKWYGVEIVVKNRQNIKGRYSGEFDNETLKEVLAGISFTTGFNYEFSGMKKVIIN